jgi:hypothetical protein
MSGARLGFRAGTPVAKEAGGLGPQDIVEQFDHIDQTNLFGGLAEPIAPARSPRGADQAGIPEGEQNFGEIIRRNFDCFRQIPSKNCVSGMPGKVAEGSQRVL